MLTLLSWNSFGSLVLVQSGKVKATVEYGAQRTYGAWDWRLVATNTACIFSFDVHQLDMLARSHHAWNLGTHPTKKANHLNAHAYRFLFFLVAC